MPEGQLTLEGDRVTLQFDRVVAASAQGAWRALSDPSTIERWLADAEFDGAVGGDVHFV